MRVGERLRRYRLERHLTQKELGQRAGIQRPNIARIEAGAHAPSLETLERLADALDIPVVELIARR